MLVKVLGIEGNRIKLSRKSLLKEQREKLGLPLPVQEGGRSERPERSESAPPRSQQPADNGSTIAGASTITIEGGEEFDDFDGTDEGEEGEEPNFNRDPAAPAAVGAVTAGGAAGNGQRRRRGRGRGGRPGGGSGAGGGRGPSQGGGRA